MKLYSIWLRERINIIVTLQKMKRKNRISIIGIRINNTIRLLRIFTALQLHI